MLQQAQHVHWSTWDLYGCSHRLLNCVSWEQRRLWLQYGLSTDTVGCTATIPGMPGHCSTHQHFNNQLKLCLISQERVWCKLGMGRWRWNSYFPPQTSMFCEIQTFLKVYVLSALSAFVASDWICVVWSSPCNLSYGFHHILSQLESSLIPGGNPTWSDFAATI